MRAAVIREIGQTPQIEEVPRPTPKAGEVLVHVLAAPINAIDKSRVAGSHYSRPPVGAIAGLVAVGEAGGRRVVVMTMAGTMAEEIAVSEGQLIPLPDGLDPAVAAAAFNPGLSAWMAVHRRGPVEPGSRVLIQGATGVTGKLAVQLARRRGAGYLVASGRNQRTLDQLLELGADATIRVDQSDSELAAAYRGQEGAGWDLVIDYLWGHPTEVLLSTLIRHDAEARALRTRLVEVGAMAGPDLRLPSAVLRSGGLEIVGLGTGTAGSREYVATAIRELYALLARGELQVDVERIPLARVAEVWDREQQGRRPVLML